MIGDSFARQPIAATLTDGSVLLQRRSARILPIGGLLLRIGVLRALSLSIAAAAASRQRTPTESRQRTPTESRQRTPTEPVKRLASTP